MSTVDPGPSLRGAVDLSALVQRHSAPPAAEGGGAPADSGGAPGVVFRVGDAEFQQVLQLSSTVPVVVEFIAAGLEPALVSLVESYGGRLALAVVDAQASPQVAQAFQVREVPAVAAVVGGRPVNLFLGIPSDDEVKQVFAELLQLAQQNGVIGTIPGGAPAAEGEPGADVEPAAPEEPPLPPLHQEAFDAISRGDLDSAITAYRKAIQQNPRDADAVAGLAQTELLARLTGTTADGIRSAAADAPGDLDAQLAVADLDVSGGHLDDAFGRLLDLFPALDADGKDRVRGRLVDYFEIAGQDDPRVLAARARLASLLY